MSLYDLHSNPEILPHYTERFEIPKLAWEEFLTRSGIAVQFGEIHHKVKPIRELESSLAKDPVFACLYAYLTKERFLLGEQTIIASEFHKRWYQNAFNIEL